MAFSNLAPSNEMNSDNFIVDRLAQVQQKIAKTAKQCGRDPGEIKIVAVTKKFPVTTMISAVNAGLTNIGENRVQETENKIPDFPFRDKIQLHLIGHLQSNKVKKAIELYDVIETVDSYKLAQRIDRIAAEMKKQQRLFLQVNTGNDPAKFGIPVDDAFDIGKKVGLLPNIILEGVMMIAPFIHDQEILRSIFKKTKDIQNEIFNSGVETCKFCSMGMTSDFDLAIKEGATHIRIGTALFGARP